MKTSRIFRAVAAAAALFLASASTAATQAAEGEWPELPPALDGSMMPYDFAACPPPADEIPDSLAPVAAAYLARHGARYLSGEKKTTALAQWLARERARGNLSQKGVAFSALLDSVVAVNTGRWGALSPVGEAEEKMLARRMAELVPALADSARQVTAVSSYVPRAVMTMYDFLHALIKENPGLEVSSAAGKQFSPLVRCFEAYGPYAAYRKGGGWQPVVEDFIAHTVPAAPAASMLADTTGTNAPALRRLTLDIYGVLSGCRASGSLPAPTERWMSVSDYRRCWAAANLRLYLRNQISPLSHLAGTATLPLLDSIAADLSRFAADPQSPLRLRGYFGHAETLLPLLSLLRIEGASAMPLDWNCLAETWKSQDIVPLGANLAFVLCRADSGTEYVVTLLNGIRKRVETLADWLGYAAEMKRAFRPQ